MHGRDVHRRYARDDCAGEEHGHSLVMPDAYSNKSFDEVVR